MTAVGNIQNMKPGIGSGIELLFTTRKAVKAAMKAPDIL